MRRNEDKRKGEGTEEKRREVKWTGMELNGAYKGREEGNRRQRKR